MKSPDHSKSGTGQAGQADRNFTPRKATRAIRQRIHHAHARLVRHISSRLDLNQLTDVLLLVGFAGGVTASTLAHALIGAGQ